VGNWVSQSRWRLYLLFLLLLILPIALFAFSASQVLKHQTEGQAAAESTQIAHVSAALVEDHFQQGADILESIATRHTIADAWEKNDQGLIAWHLQSAKSLRPDFAFVSMYDLDGKMRAIYPPQPEMLGRSFAERDWYKGVSRQWKPYVSEVYQTAVPPYPLVAAIAVPVCDKQGKPVAILMGADSLDTISQRFAETRIDGGWTILLVDQNGHVASHRGADPNAVVDIVGAGSSANEAVKRLQGKTRNASFIHDGETRFSSYEAGGQTGWGVVVEQSDSVLQHGVWAVERRLWLLGLVFLLLGLGLSAFMGSLYSQLETGNRFIKLSVDMFCIIGFDGFFKSLNPSWEKTLGFTREELMAKPRYEFIHPEDRVLTTSETDRLQQGEVTLAFENRYLCKDGSYKWLLWNAVSAPGQEVIYAVARDITARKLAEARLRESEERHRKLFELNPQPIWIYDRETLRFLAVNKAALQNYGYSLEEFLAMTIQDIRPLEDIPALLKSVSAMHDGQREYGVWRHRKKDGSLIFVEITSYSFEFSGRPADFVIAVDVTERRRAEKERHEFTERLAAANQELEVRNRDVERATRLKSKFLASMSHELRTPLNAIVGFSELLGDGIPGELNPKQKRFVNHIRQGSVHLLQLINDILDLSKIEAGQIELRCEDFVIGEALPEVLSIIRPLVMAKNIEVVQKLETNRPVYADRVRFKQVLYNLLSNAVKFTSKDGSIEIRCYDEGNLIALSVTDTGIGIRPEDQEMVFEEFRQVEGDAGAKQEGTGLGLAITRRLVEQQGGKIWLESKPGAGSRFTFTLPHGGQAHGELANGEGTATFLRPPAPVAVTESARKPLVLIVDDEVPARELLVSYLETEYRVAVADSGAEAVKKAKELRPDAITLDVVMPGGSGFESLVALKATPETADIPVIIVSIVDQQRVGFALGATDYLIKPIHQPTLLETIRKHVAIKTDDDSAILVVDDDPKSIELVEETLRSAGYETQSVRSGARALEVLRSKLVGAVLLDLLMPGMDGFQVIRHVRQEPTLRNLPILVMTAKNLTQEEIDLLSQDTQGFFQKSGSWPQQLSAEVGRVLQRRAQLHNQSPGLTKAAGQL
jgi:PAS domain S-box-containing protein